MKEKQRSTDKRHDLFRAIDALGKMFAVIDRNRKILTASVNPALAPPGDHSGKNCFRIFFDRDAPCENCGLEKAAENGRPVLAPRKDMEADARGRFHNYIYPLFDGGRVTSWVCLGLELPVSDNAKQMAELSKSFFYNLVQSAADGVIVADRKGKIRVFNQTAAGLFGYEVEEALAGMDIRALYTEGGAYDVMAKLRDPDYGGRGKLIGYRTTVMGKGGGTIPIRINASIVYQGNREIATVGFFHDRREDLRSDDASKEGLSDGAGVRHSAPLGDVLSTLDHQLRIYDTRFGEAAVGRGWATATEVENALEKQREISSKAKIHIPIGRIMIQLGMITEQQRDELLRSRATESFHEPGKSEQGPGQSLSGKASPVPGTASVDAVSRDDAEKIEIEISEDRLTASVSPAGNLSRHLAPEKIQKFAADRGIVFGLLTASQIQEQIDDVTRTGQPLRIAQGKAPEGGTPPTVRYFFETDPLRIGTTREDGSIDWKDRGKLPQVKAGELLAEIVPGTEGVPGTDVFGMEIPPAVEKPFIPKPGKGTEKSEDGQRFLAARDGMVTIALDGALTVEQALKIDGDIGLETGHIHFEGHIEVARSIQKGFRVRGHSLRAGDIQGAEVRVAGGMTVMEGIYESDIKCMETLKAGHIYKSRIVAAGGLVVGREIIESRIETNGRCEIKDGSIIASEISAKKGIAVRNIGTHASGPSRLTVGVDQERKRTMEKIREGRRVLRKEQRRLRSELEALRRRSEETAEALGQAAQRQDRYMVQIRDLENRKADPAAGEEDKDVAEKVEMALRLLLSQKQQQDAAVEDLLNRDEEISEKIQTLESEWRDAGQGLAQLDREMEGLDAASAADPGVAVVKVSGTIAPKTTITGPRSTRVVQEELRRVQIMETDKPDKNGNRSWHMEVMPLR